MKKKLKPNSFINKIQIFNLLVLIASVLLAQKFGLIFLLAFSAVSLVVIIVSPHRWINLSIALIGCSTVLVLWYLLPNMWNLKQMSQWLNEKLQHFSLRDLMLKQVNTLYEDPQQAFLRILIFNEKMYTNSQYMLFRDLGMLHLFVVSGLHISVLCAFFSYLFKRCYWLGLLFNLVVSCLLFYLAGFSISILRIIISLIISQIKPFKRLSSFDKNCWVGVMLCLLVKDASSYSFILTMICTLAINFIVMVFSHFLTRLFYINFLLFFVSLPITISFNGYLNILAILNSFAYSYVFIFMFYYALLFSWIGELVQFNNHVWNFLFVYFERLLWSQHLWQVKLNDIVIATIYFLEYLGLNYYFYQLNSKKHFWINYNKLYV